MTAKKHPRIKLGITTWMRLAKIHTIAMHSPMLNESIITPEILALMPDFLTQSKQMSLGRTVD